MGIRSYCLCLLMLLAFLNIQGQSAEELPTSKDVALELGVELQAYPTGLIPTFKGEVIISNKHAVSIRIGYNWFDHRNLGVHDSEDGGGPGYSIGYKRYFENEGLKGFYVGLHTDLWFNHVNWSEHENNDRNHAMLYRGSSDIIVFQPTIDLGYRIEFNDSKIAFVPNFGIGWEWNLKTTADISPSASPFIANDVDLTSETGEGLIVLLGFSFMFNLTR